MLKKIIVVIAMLALIGLSIFLIRKTPNNNEVIVSEDSQQQPVPEEVLPEQNFTWNTQNITEDCSMDEAKPCAVETAVKCTVRPDLKICNKDKLPKFIFMTDPSINRPTEVNYRFIGKKNLPNNTVEIYTESDCNGTWFGLCQGTVIYVLTTDEKNSENWFVRDIYAIE